jgi:hypothetical protein
MDRRDQELLNKQLEHLLPPPRSEGMTMLAIVAVFAAGVSLGSFLFAHNSEPPMRTASTQTIPAPPLAPGAPASVAR